MAYKRTKKGIFIPDEDRLIILYQMLLKPVLPALLPFWGYQML
jgi:hypothetical protein